MKDVPVSLADKEYGNRWGFFKGEGREERFGDAVNGKAKRQKPSRYEIALRNFDSRMLCSNHDLLPFLSIGVEWRASDPNAIVGGGENIVVKQGQSRLQMS